MRRAMALCACVAAGAAPALFARAEESAAPRSFAYVLQAEGIGKTREEAVRRLRECGRDWLVIDPAYDDDRDSRWTEAELQSVRGGKAGRKVLAYLSIGEAENYRRYWKREWDANRDGKPDAKAPRWLCAENPEWKGNYRVKYWQEAWQSLMLESVDDVVAQGFDGLYLDGVDAFEFFEYDSARKAWLDDRPNPETTRTYREDLAAWVLRVAARARQQRAGFLVVPQNGAQLLEQAAFLAAIDAVGVEDLFTDGKHVQPDEHVDAMLGYLRRATQGSKPVLVIDYATKPKLQQLAAEGARKHGLVLLTTDRELKTLGHGGSADGR